MTLFLLLLLVGLSTSACEKNLKRSLEISQLPAPKRVRLQSYVAKDSNDNVYKVRIKLFFDYPDSIQHTKESLKDRVYNDLGTALPITKFEPENSQGYSTYLLEQKNISNTFGLLMNEVCRYQEAKNVWSVIHRMEDMLKKVDEHVKTPEMFQVTLWNLARKAIATNISKDHLLPFLYFYLKNDIDLFTIKNNENKTLIEYAVHENCCSLAQALLQFNSELALKLQGKVTLITQDNLTALKEIAQDEKIKNVLSAVYEP